MSLRNLQVYIYNVHSVQDSRAIQGGGLQSKLQSL